MVAGWAIAGLQNIESIRCCLVICRETGVTAERAPG